MKRILCLLILAATANVCYAQNNAIEDLRKGANILARQFYDQKELHKAKTMAKFVTIIDESNPKNKLLVKTISESSKMRVYSSIDDNGIAYSEFLMNLLKVLPDNEQTREKRIYGLYICSVLNPEGPAGKMLPPDRDFSNFYSDLFSNEESPEPVMEELTAIEAVKQVKLDTLNYNPTELLEAINAVNYKLRNTGSQINIETESITVHSVDDDNGYNIIDGPPLKASDKNILFKNITVLEFLKYIEHTTVFSYQLEGSSINIIDAHNGKNGRPEHFKISKSISEDIQRSIIKSRSVFDNKSMQIKGMVTQIKDTDTNFLIQIDNLFVVFVDKKYMKAESVALITKKFTEYDDASKNGPLSVAARNKPFLELTVRGKCKINKINQIYLSDCHSILAENVGIFYTK